ncbi:transcription factor 25 [Plakobranchus ocellatus]|uniref:Transcription factor 25 n=1 Tax=Plakobranchus ocellatus TaxID=259542 RepID=A0AAV3YC07_9GAST|nr:transcription factor 25 [Plakobranchus ocellatus]
MSSRALRRLQRDSGIGLEYLPNEENLSENREEIEIVASRSKKKGKREALPLNPFELLTNGLEDQMTVSDKEEESDSNGKPVSNNQSDKAVHKNKKKKKSRKKQNDNQTSTPDALKEKEPEDEIEASLQEVNRILGNTSIAHVQEKQLQGSNSTNMKPLLHIDHRNLNPETELKRMFGSQVVMGEQQDRHRRQRNRPVQRSSRLVQPKDTWHPTGGSGLSMKYLGETEGFTFEHSPAYQKMQHLFYDAVESGHPEAIVNILRKHPYHIDALIQMSEFHRINEDFQTSAEFIEKAIYGMECAFHSMFNIAAGNCHLTYDRPENRSFYLCIFKHILNLGRRGCNRTAFEFCKLLLSLNPEDDPLDCMSMIDFYALRSEQYEYLKRLDDEALSFESSRRVPNFAFSLALAQFKDALKKKCDTKTADERLQDALLFFPVLLKPLLDQCCVQPDKRVNSHPFFDSKEMLDSTSELGRLVTLYVKRCESCWKELEVMSWLERNVLAVLDIVDSGTDKRIQEYAELRRKKFRNPPLSLLRHYFLSEIQGVSPPQRFTSGPILSYDPFPPPRSIISYVRPERPTVASESSSSIIRSFFESIRPSYNPQAPPGAGDQRLAQGQYGNGEEGAEGGARAIPHQIHESVHALMEAMRQLLNDPFPRPARPEEEEPEADNEEEWRDDERPDDLNNQR